MEGLGCRMSPGRDSLLPLPTSGGVGMSWFWLG